MWLHLHVSSIGAATVDEPIGPFGTLALNSLGALNLDNRHLILQKWHYSANQSATVRCHDGTVTYQSASYKA